jgi:hypothetical protein
VTQHLGAVSIPRISIGPAGCRINRDYARRGWATETGHPNCMFQPKKIISLLSEQRPFSLATKVGERGDGGRLWVFAWCLRNRARGFHKVEYRQPNIFGSPRGDQDRTSETVFIKIKGISPLKGIKK